MREVSWETTGRDGLLMVTTIQLGTIEAEVILKDIKNVHLSVHRRA
jgi:hypothetical protein